MVTIKIEKNEGNQRLDRFLRKYYNKAPLDMIYRMIRKDIKVNGKRLHRQDMVEEGDVITVYMEEEKASSLRREMVVKKVRRQFSVAYEDADLLAVSKPVGLLTHGDSHQRKNTLASQVVAYLVAKGNYHPRGNRTFTPSPANRLDRNTSGLVIFGKNAEALRQLNTMIRQRDGIEKYYCAIVGGTLTEPLFLKDYMEKDSRKNQVHVTEDPEGRLMETKVYPLAHGQGYTLVKIHLLTGRTHQIRVQMAACGHPVIGDAKYGAGNINKQVTRRFHLTTQLLHAWQLKFRKGEKAGLTITAPPPSTFEKIAKELFGTTINFTALIDKDSES